MFGKHWKEKKGKGEREREEMREGRSLEKKKKESRTGGHKNLGLFYPFIILG